MLTFVVILWLNTRGQHAEKTLLMMILVTLYNLYVRIIYINFL